MGDHRDTGMVERLIQTKKRRIALMEYVPIWSPSDLATIIAKIIESLRPIPKTTTRIKPFEAHFGGPPNTELSNINTKLSAKICHTKKLTNMFQIKQPFVNQLSLVKLCGTGTMTPTRAQHPIQSAVAAHPTSNNRI